MTTIGPSLTITGSVTSNEDITIHGGVNGDIKMNTGALVVAPNARVKATVQALQMTIHGTLSGDGAAAERVELAPTATVDGTLLAPAVIIREGAMFNGDIAVEGTRPKVAKTA